MAKKPNKKLPAGTGKNGDAKVNKSAAIRDYLKANKKAMPKQIVAALKEKGIDVSPNMVSIIKAKSKVKRARRQRIGRNGLAPNRAPDRNRAKPTDWTLP